MPRRWLEGNEEGAKKVQGANERVLGAGSARKWWMNAMIMQLLHWCQAGRQQQWRMLSPYSLIYFPA